MAPHTVLIRSTSSGGGVESLCQASLTQQAFAQAHEDAGGQVLRGQHSVRFCLGFGLKPELTQGHG